MAAAKRNRWLWLFALLLVGGVGAGLYFRPPHSKAIPPGFQMQDSSFVPAGRMKIKIWDYSIRDSDIVHIIFDGRKIYRNLLLSDTPVVYDAGYVEKGRHWIGVESISEGFVGAASPHISISNGKTSFEFDIDAYRDKPAYRLLIAE